MTVPLRFATLLWLGLCMNFADQNIELNQLIGELSSTCGLLYTPFAWLSGLSQPWQWTRLRGWWWVVGSAREVIIPSILFALFYTAILALVTRYSRLRPPITRLPYLPLLLSIPYLAFAIYSIAIRVPPPPNPA
jgi:hypothetical protein